MLSRKDYLGYKKVVRTQSIIRVSRAFLVLVLVFFSVIFIYNFDLEFKNGISTDNNILHGDSGPECSNLSFQLTAVCLNNYVREMPFVYNVTDDKIDLTLEDLQKRGGDCRDWTNFYLKYMELYGYDQDNQRIRGLVEKNENVSMYHVSLMSFHLTGYCHFDMTDLECYQYVNDDGEIRG